MALTGMEISELARDKPGDPWTLNELDETTEEVNTEAVNTLVSLLDDLKIVGVRPKPAGLSKNLKVSEDLKLDPISAMDLRSKGFLVARDQDGRQIFVADEGEMLASTNQGVVYHLYFGEVSTGTDVEIELGKTPEENAAEAEKETTEGDDTPDEKDDEKKQGQNRYMFVTVNFDETLIGPPLQEPVAPTKPSAEAESKSEDATPEAETESESESEPLTEGTDDNKTDDAESATDAEDEAKAEDEVKAENAEAPADEPTEPQAEAKPTAEEAEAAYQQALKLYEADLAKYKLDVSQRTEKTKQGQEIVKDLNDRFANWYYVISASSFENLRLGRAAFVKPKTAETDDTTEGNPAPPDASTPEDSPESEDDPVEAEKPALESSDEEPSDAETPPEK